MISKSKPQRNPHLLRMARGRPCLLGLPGCDGGGATTVAAHSNSMKHGKAMGRKADDCFSAWSCASCHRALDQGPASQGEKEVWFGRAHRLQVWWWQRISDDPLSKPKDIEAARWALERLAR